MSLKSRFEHDDDLTDALVEQRIVGDLDVAAAFAKVGELIEFHAGRNII